MDIDDGYQKSENCVEKDVGNESQLEMAFDWHELGLENRMNPSAYDPILNRFESRAREATKEQDKKGGSEIGVEPKLDPELI